MSATRAADRLARRWFWTLLLVAVVAMGALYTALGAGGGPLTGLAVLVSSVVLLASATQAGRILLALERARRRGSRDLATPAEPVRRLSLGERLLGPRAMPAPETHDHR